VQTSVQGKTAPNTLATVGQNVTVADLDDVRRLALALPEVIADDDQVAFSVMVKGKAKGFAWPWNERIEPKKPKVRNLDVYAIRVANGSEKEMLLASDPAKYFTEDHYNGFPAVLVRIVAVDVEEMRELLTDAWRSVAPKAVVRAFDTQNG
jgi:hypothetical protein